MILAVGPDSPESFRQYWQREALPFIGLPDPGKSVLKRYKQEVKLMKLGRMPALLIIDRLGIIRFAHYGNSMSDIPGNPLVLSFIDDLNQGINGSNG